MKPELFFILLSAIYVAPTLSEKTALLFGAISIAVSAVFFFSR